MFLEDFRKRGGLWILKPTGRCQGSGIFLVNKLTQVTPYRTKVSQQGQP
jgi:tubulin polyglutamylase TTLL9